MVRRQTRTSVCIELAWNMMRNITFCAHPACQIATDPTYLVTQEHLKNLSISRLPNSGEVSLAWMDMVSKMSSNGGYYCVPKWILQTARIFGYWPWPVNIDISSELHLTSRIRFNIRNYLWPAFAVMIYVLCIYVQLSTSVVSQVYVFSNLEDIIDKLTNVGYALTSIFTIFMCAVWNCDAFTEFIQIIRNVDQEVLCDWFDWNHILNAPQFSF